MQGRFNVRKGLSVWIVFSLGLGGALQGFSQTLEEYPVAGTQPDRRPENAPVLTEIKKDADWYTQALTGLQPPYPQSLNFLDNQAGWYTPFNHPGMRGRYDLRGWHQDSK